MTPDERHDDIDEFAAAQGWGEVLASLAEPDAATPPMAARADLLAAARLRPRAGVEPVAPTEVYGRRVSAMEALLHDLAAPDWEATVEEYGWSVHRLVAHLTVIEEYTARQFGLTGAPPVPIGDERFGDHLALGDDVVVSLVDGDPAETTARWAAAARRIVDHVASPTFDATAPVALHAWPFSASTALVVRAFEIWTHADDICRATGRPLTVPDAAELRTISSTSVSGLPVLLALSDEATLAPTRVVLTGPGGGTFDLGVPPGEVAFNLLVADVVDYCRVVARRIEPDALAGERRGDGSLLSALLRAAQAIAV